MQNWWLPLEGGGVFSGPDDIEIVAADFDEANLWVKTVAAVAKRRGLGVGGGVLHLHGETASVRTTSCRIEHRNQGVQSALLAFRLNEALEAGCCFAFSSTAQPGHSARNLNRFGCPPQKFDNALGSDSFNPIFMM